MSRLRAKVGLNGALVTRPPGYLLQVDAGQLDAARFVDLVHEARTLTTEQPSAAVTHLDEALSLWRGPAYGEFAHEAFAIPEAARLEELRLFALEDRIDARLALGHHAEVIAESEALVADHPLRERLRSQLMIALYASGRHTDALRACEAYRRLLADELGLDPSPALRRLEEQILRHDPALQEGRRSARRTPPATPSTSFVGRDAQVSALISELQQARLVTLTGPGGVGKTRLALYVAAQAQSDFADGTVVCELAPITEPGAVGQALATGLQIQRRSQRTIEDTLVEFLRTKALLLVLDNCEHVIDAVAVLVAQMLESCPGVSVLATSRERLDLPGERLCDVPPLEVGPAVALFCGRARAVRPGITLDKTALDEVGEICRQLDGLPLAIELAAARMRAMNTSDIAARLGDRFALLGKGARNAPRRHRSLRAVVEWSYGLLPELERQLFDRLSVFAAAFTAEAAQQVCAGAGLDAALVPGLLAELIDKSMATIGDHGGAARYSLLGTLRAYGHAQLEQRGEVDRWQRRHAQHYVAFVEEADRGLRGPDELVWVTRIEGELGNLRVAHDWTITVREVDLALRFSIALQSFAWRLVRPEMFAWAERAAEMAADTAHPLLPLAWGSAAEGA